MVVVFLVVINNNEGILQKIIILIAQSIFEQNKVGSHSFFVSRIVSGAYQQHIFVDLIFCPSWILVK